MSDKSPSSCRMCGSRLYPGTKFCETCGAKTETTPSCSQCGAALSPGVKFCESCGTPVGLAEIPQPPAPVSGIPMPASQIPGIPHGQVPPAGKKPMAGAGLIIVGVAILIVLACGVYFIGFPLLSGNGGVQGGTIAPTVTPAVTRNSVTVTPGQSAVITTRQPTQVTRNTGPLIPGPTDQLPSELGVTMRVDKDVISGAITVMLTGGQGRLAIRDCLVTVTHPDSTTVTGTILPGKKVNEITLPGSKGTDRVEVLVTYLSGQQYRVIDQLMPYAPRGP